MKKKTLRLIARSRHLQPRSCQGAGKFIWMRYTGGGRVTYTLCERLPVQGGGCLSLEVTCSFLLAQSRAVIAATLRSARIQLRQRAENSPPLVDKGK